MNGAAHLAPLLEGFFTKRLIGQRRASPHTVASYRDTFRLLLRFAEERVGRAPSKLTLEDFNAPFAASYLDQRERQRANGARSRNLRLSAIRSFFRYATLEAPHTRRLFSARWLSPASATRAV
jgi:integrase/recombinase XerD